jgi:hypothetical protein
MPFVVRAICQVNFILYFYHEYFGGEPPVPPIASLLSFLLSFYFL